MQKRTETEPAMPAVAGRVLPVRLVCGPMTARRWIASSIGVVIVIALIAVACWYHMAHSAAAAIDKSTYQAVFVSNNQAFFGKLQRLGDGAYKLTNVYYLQQGSNTAQKANTGDQTPQLVKMGSELHGPTDQVVFDAHQVLFWENLRSDSKVVKAIGDYEKK